jgi:hypothetical protein
MLIFELFPWHSMAVTAPMRSPGDIIDRFAWRPVAEIDTRYVLAFGKHWDSVAKGLHPEAMARLGAGRESHTVRVCPAARFACIGCPAASCWSSMARRQRRSCAQRPG